MNRDTLQAVLFGLGAAAVLAFGGWLFIAGGDSSTDDGASPSAAQPSRASSDARDGPRTIDIPRCPLEVRLGPSFRRKETEHPNPNLRVQSPRRALQVEFSCRISDQDFDRSQFLRETLQAVEARYEGELEDKRDIESGPAAGWSTWRIKGNERRFFIVLVDGRTIYNIDVFGARTSRTNDFVRTLVDEKLVWPGAETSTDPSGRDAAVDSDDE